MKQAQTKHGKTGKAFNDLRFFHGSLRNPEHVRQCPVCILCGTMRHGDVASKSTNCTNRLGAGCAGCGHNKSGSKAQSQACKMQRWHHDGILNDFKHVQPDFHVFLIVAQECLTDSAGVNHPSHPSHPTQHAQTNYK